MSSLICKHHININTNTKTYSAINSFIVEMSNDFQCIVNGGPYNNLGSRICLQGEIVMRSVYIFRYIFIAIKTSKVK